VAPDKSGTARDKHQMEIFSLCIQLSPRSP
jgi:hypothetical protein